MSLIAEVGPNKQVSKRRDKLIRPQYGRRLVLSRYVPGKRQ